MINILLLTKEQNTVIFRLHVLLSVAVLGFYL